MEGSYPDCPRDAFHSLGLGVTSWSPHLRHTTETLLDNIYDNNDHDDDVPAWEAQIERRNGQQHDGNATRTGEEGDATESLSISTIDDLKEDHLLETDEKKFEQLSFVIDVLDSSTIPSLDDSYVMIDDDEDDDSDENDDGIDIAMNLSHNQEKYKEQKQEERESDSLPFPILFVKWQ